MLFKIQFITSCEEANVCEHSSRNIIFFIIFFRRARRSGRQSVSRAHSKLSWSLTIKRYGRNFVQNSVNKMTSTKYWFIDWRCSTWPSRISARIRSRVLVRRICYCCYVIYDTIYLWDQIPHMNEPVKIHIIYLVYQLMTWLIPLSGADGSIRLFDLRHLEHSTIVYEVRNEVVYFADNKLFTSCMLLKHRAFSRYIFIYGDY